MVWVIALIAVALVLVVALVVTRRRMPNRQSDYDQGVESFRRHMNALSPEARKGVSDRVREARDKSSSVGE